MEGKPAKNCGCGYAIQSVHCGSIQLDYGQISS